MAKNDNLSISDDSSITIPLRNLIGLIATAGVVVMGYFQLTERITMLERDLHLAERYIEQNSEFRIKWPLGELGSLPADVMQDSQILALNKVVTANSDFRVNWAPPPEVQESVRTNHEQEIRISFLQDRVAVVEKQLSSIGQMAVVQSGHEAEIRTQGEKIETLFDLWNSKPQ